MDLVDRTPFPDMFERRIACESNSCLLQGDIIKKSEEYELADRPFAIGYLVVSNSCDLDNYNVSAILFVPIYPFDHWYKDHSHRRPSEFANIVYKETNYGGKGSFFISPLDGFNDKPSVAFLDDIISIPISKHIFRWEEVPGADEGVFKYNLFNWFGIEWMIDAEVEKTETNMVIKASFDSRSLILELSEDKTNVVLTQDDDTTINFIANKKGNILSIAYSNQGLLLNDRMCSIKPPWREQLGYKMGNMFNRISTYSPNKDNVLSWAKTYKERVSISSIRHEDQPEMPSQ